MYLSKLNIKNFRSIRNSTFNFTPGINILIGENNSGKTSVLDVLRICLGYKQSNALRIKKEDFNIFNPNESIEFDLSFDIDEDYERAYFIELYNARQDTLELHYRFSINNNLPLERINIDIWGGENEGQNIPNEIFQLFINVYLGALRDAKKYLNPGRYNYLSQFFEGIDEKMINHNFDKTEMVTNLNKQIEDSSFSEFINEVNNQHISNHLRNVSFDDKSNMNISWLSQNFEDYTKNLKIKLNINEDSKEEFLDLNQNGLGNNNLIYISLILTSLTFLKKQENALYLSLLIEEPEAHLQPQLQNLFFSYLNELNEKLNKDKSFQIFISSHSPTLTAKADLNSIVILQNNDNDVLNSNFEQFDFNEDNKKFLQKFLDVTKSQLLFSKKVIFVEGISEALLIPVFAEKLGYNLDKKGIEIVNMQGVSFKHFMPLFKKDNEISFKGIILTDDDRKEINGEPSKNFNSIKKFDKTHNIKVFASEKTFEYDLLKSNIKKPIIFNIFKENNNNIFNMQNDDIKAIFDVFNDKRSISKSDIALQLSLTLTKDDDYNIPKYIEEGLNYICGD